MEKRLIVFLFLSGALANAELGGDIVTIEKDRKTIGLDRAESKTFANYRIEKSVSENVQVHQFLNKDGKVFAIAWSGHVDKQIPQLLGTYAQMYQKSEAQHVKRAGRIPYRKVMAGPLTVEYWDMLRKVEGKAYVTTLLPAEVTPENINVHAAK